MKDAPQELIDLVVDFVHEDRSTLCAARLVCGAWNVSARVQLFRRLKLLFTDPPTPKNAPRLKNGVSMPVANVNPQRKYGAARIQQLLDILHSSSSVDMSLASFVREVAIGNTEHLTDEQWTAYERLLPPILSIFSPITRLSLYQINWNRFSLSTPCIQAIMALCRYPAFKHLDMADCKFLSTETLMDVLNFSGNLESLRLSFIRSETEEANKEVGVVSSVDAVRNRQHQRKPLRKLTLEHIVPTMLPILDALLTPNFSFDINQLRWLSLGYVANHMPSVCRLLRAIGGNLEVLEIRGSFHHRTENAGYFNLSLTPRLKSLRISGMLWTPQPSSTEYLLPLFDIHPANASAAYSSPHSHPLEYLDVSVTASRTKNQAFDMTQWTTLDAALAQPLFSALKTVTIAVGVGTIMQREDVDVTLLASAFPQLLAANKIDIHIVDS